MIDQLEFNQNQGNLGATRSTTNTNARSSSSSSTSRTSAGTSTRSRSSSSRSSATSTSFLDRLKETASKAVQVVDQARQAHERTTSAQASSGGSRTSTSTGTKSTGRSGVVHDPDAPIQVTKGQSGQRTTRAESPEENNDRMQATYYLNEFKALAKQVEEQGYVLSQEQYAELQNIMAQYQQNNGDLATLSLMAQYSQLEVEGGRPTSNPIMAAFGDMDSKKVIYIGAGLLGLVVLKKMTKRKDK